MSSFIRGSLGTTQVTQDDVTTPTTRLFSHLKYVDDFKASKTITYRGLNTGSGIYHFDIETNSEEYLDLSRAFITYNLKLTNPAGQKVNYEQLFVVPDIANAMWQRGTVRIGNSDVIGLTEDYLGYVEYIKGLINYSKRCRGNKLVPRVFLLDDPGFYNGDEGFKDYGMKYTRSATNGWEWEEYADPNDATKKLKRVKGKTDTRTDKEKRLPIMVRHQITSDFDIFQICTPLPSHLMGVSRSLPTNLRLEFDFYPQNSDFYFLTKDATLPKEGYKLEIQDMLLTVNVQTVNDEILLKHQKAFETMSAIIPFQALDVKIGLVSAGMTRIEHKPWSDVCPKQVITALVKQSAFIGNRGESPYNFEHCNAEYMYLKIGNYTFPHTLIKTNYPERRIQQQFTYAMHNLGQGNGDHASLLELDDYNNGTTLGVWTLTPDLCPLWHLHKNIMSSCEVIYELGVPVPEAMRLICIGVFDRTLKIDRFRQATVVNI